MPRLFAALILYAAILALSAGLGWKAAQLQRNEEAAAAAAARGAAPPAPAARTQPAAREPAALPVEAAPEKPRPAAPASAAAQRPAPVAAPADERQAPAPAAAGAAGRRIFVLISLPSQRAFVFKDGKLWDSSRVSTGRRGKRTPTGTFTILEKQVHHRSTKYDDAPMPYMQRLTWGGVALHAGHVPGYPASHGCIRMPWGFARRLYRVTDMNSTVVVVTATRVDSAASARKYS